MINLDAGPTFVHKLLQAAMCFNKGSGVKGQENGVTVPCKNGMPQEHKGKPWKTIYSGVPILRSPI